MNRVAQRTDTEVTIALTPHGMDVHEFVFVGVEPRIDEPSRLHASGQESGTSFRYLSPVAMQPRLAQRESVATPIPSPWLRRALVIDLILLAVLIAVWKGWM